MQKKPWEDHVNKVLRNAVPDTKLRCEIEENEKRNRWRITLVDSSHPTSYMRTKWLGGISCLHVIDGIEMVIWHIASRETFFQEIGQKHADILGLKAEL